MQMEAREWPFPDRTRCVGAHLSAITVRPPLLPVTMIGLISNTEVTASGKAQFPATEKYCSSVGSERGERGRREKGRKRERERKQIPRVLIRTWKNKAGNIYHTEYADALPLNWLHRDKLFYEYFTIIGSLRGSISLLSSQPRAGVEQRLVKTRRDWL